MTTHDPDDPHARRRRDPHPGFPVDSDVDDSDLPSVPERAWRLVRSRRDVLLAIAVGGALGSAARWALAYTLPHARDEFPWSTLLANVAGCFALGVLMVVIVETRPDSRLLRPFFGTGLLGGFTTFSTYTVDTRGLLASGRPALAAAYVVATLGLGLLAVVVALRATERVVR